MISLCREYWYKLTNLLFKTTEWNKYRLDKLIGQFTNPNETARRSYFDQYWMTISEFHSERETMAHFFIEWLKFSRSNNNQDWKNAASLYNVTMLTTGRISIPMLDNISYQDFEGGKIIPTPHSRRGSSPFFCIISPETQLHLK